jgi:hypothetical protein
LKFYEVKSHLPQESQFGESRRDVKSRWGEALQAADLTEFEVFEHSEYSEYFEHSEV